MKELSIISQEDFEKRKNNKNTIIINDEINTNTIYQLEMNNIRFLVFGREEYKPNIKEISGYYVVLNIGNCYFYSINKLELIKKINNLVFIYDVFQNDKTVILISEIDIFCFDNDLIEIKHIMADDIIVKYQVKSNFILWELSNGEKKELKL